MIVEDILSLIPQKTPFVMVDKLLACDDNQATTSFLITPDNVMVSAGEFTEGGLMENIAQSAAAGAGYLTQDSGGHAGGYIVSVKNFEVFALPKVNDMLITTVDKTGRMLGMLMILGTITCNNEVLAKCEMSIFEGK
jgi:predicted hotdog family 3-hydroxylacyl-ACP dehydratase